MFRMAIVGFACGLVAACGGGEVIQRRMDSLRGQPLAAVVARLGMPTEERTIAGQKVYVWFRRVIDEGSEYKCQIRVFMSGEVIGGWDHEGDPGQCRRYAAMLDR